MRDRPILSTCKGAPAWASDDQSITSAAVDHGVLFRVRVMVNPPPFVQNTRRSAPDSRFVVYST
jgi:hypothetical protein